MINQTRLKVFNASPVYKLGVLVPRNHMEAMDIDTTNKNTKWRDAEKLELKQLEDYNALRDMGRDKPPPNEYKKISAHFVYDVKHDLRPKARLVAGGHLTGIPTSSVYSTVVSLRGLRITLQLDENNGLETWVTDVGNAYLEAYTEEKVYFIAGPEFMGKEGHTMIIRKALYGLKSSGLKCWERFSFILRDMGFG